MEMAIRDVPVLVFAGDDRSTALAPRPAIPAQVPFWRVRDPKWATIRDMDVLAQADDKVANGRCTLLMRPASR